MDELIPPVIRDSRIFMWLFYCAAYRTLNPIRYMKFKSTVFKMSQNEYAEFYKRLDSISRNRLTDNNEKCIKQILTDCKSAAEVLDVGCGRGYVLNRLRVEHPSARLAGVDLLRDNPSNSFEYFNSPAERLPFYDGEFDVVCCTHVIEHVPDPNLVVHELMRVAHKKVIIVTPKQRPFYFTLDEHINFYYYKEQLERIVPRENAVETKILSGDWYLVIYK